VQVNEGSSLRAVDDGQHPHGELAEEETQKLLRMEEGAAKRVVGGRGRRRVSRAVRRTRVGLRIWRPSDRLSSWAHRVGGPSWHGHGGFSFR
jgi:hypothetical protein